MDYGTLYNTSELVNKRWSEKLYASVDGGGLRHSAKTPYQHQRFKMRRWFKILVGKRLHHLRASPNKCAPHQIE